MAVIAQWKGANDVDKCNKVLENMNMKRQKMPKIPIMRRLPLFLLLTLFWCQSAQCAEEEGAMISGPGFDKLDLSEFRKSILSEGDARGGRQQFQDAASAGGVGGVGGGGGNEVVGVGLIDALQRWADALEAQVGRKKIFAI